MPDYPYSKMFRYAHGSCRRSLTNQGQDTETLAACIGRKNKKCSDQITGILAPSAPSTIWRNDEIRMT